MKAIEIMVSESMQISQIEADILILKNISDGIFGPEKEINEKTENSLTKFHKKEFFQLGKIVEITNSHEIVKSKNIILVGFGELEYISYSSIHDAFKKAFQSIIKKHKKAVNVLTVAHGVGMGLNKKEVFIQIITALISVVKESNFKNSIKSPIFNESGVIGRPQIFSYIRELTLISPNLFVEQGEKFFLNYRNQEVLQNNMLGGNNTESQKQKILFLGANPLKTTRIRIEEEVREIEEGLKRSRNRDAFDFVKRFATRPIDLTRAILDENPKVLHFSGHGEKEGIILEDKMGHPKMVEKLSLGNLFKLFEKSVICVILNSCYSLEQAEEIAKYIPYVIGMNNAINDNTAIAFSVSFYDAIGAGKDIEFAYKLGIASIDLEGLAGNEIPKLIKRNE